MLRKSIKKLCGVHLACLCAFCLIIDCCMAQGEYGKYQLGVYSLHGNSLGVSPVSSTVQNQISPTQHGFVGVGLYSYFQLRDDSTFMTAGFFRFMRIDAGVASRSGIFEISQGSLARVTSADVDLTCLFPLSFKAAPEALAYAMVGPVLTVQYNRTIVPDQTLPDASSVRMGLAIETGFRLRSGSYLGYRTMFQAGNFNYRVGAITFGFSPQNLPKRKKK